MIKFDKASVVGAGTMGHGIAFILAQAGIKVALIDQRKLALETALNKISGLLESMMAKSLISTLEATETLNRIIYSQDLDAMSDADLMIEAIGEDIEQKQSLFSLAESLVNEDALLASNTSSLSITSIAQALVHKDRVLGLHFFNPPYKMKLLEIIVHEDCSLDAVDAARALGQMLRKECIVVNDSPGFATSRLGICFALEAIRMLEQRVAGVLELDSAMKLGYGHPMGPLMLSDWVGLDIRLAISERLYRSLNSAAFLPPDLLRRMVRAGLLGRKSGSGFYDWNEDRHLGVSHALAELCL